MDSTALVKSAAVSELTLIMCNFLDELVLSKIDAVDGRPLDDVLARLEETRKSVAEGEKLEMKMFKPVLEALGLDRKSFETAAVNIQGAAIDLRSEFPGLLTADSDARRDALRRAISSHATALSFVAARSRAAEEAIQPVIYGGGIPEVLGSDFFDDCETNCSFAAALAFADALVAALERSLFCAGAAVVPIIAFLCLMIVAVAFVLAGKAAEKALEDCLANCN